MQDRELAEIALGAAREAAAVHQRHVGRVPVESWSEKGRADFVTHVDLEAEEAVISYICERCPDHAFLAEEGTGSDGAAPQPGDGSPWTWVVDPLDGTTNFLHGYPAYAASVAVLDRGEPAAGAVVSAATGDEWTAWRGGGAYKNGRAIRVSGVRRLEHALIGTGFPFKAHHLLPEYLVQLDAMLRRASGVRRAGSAALDLCHLATGYFDGFWELYLSPWDVAAGAIIVREAGGVITTLEGDPDIMKVGSLLAGNPAIYDALRNLLREVTPRR